MWTKDVENLKSQVMTTTTKTSALHVKVESLKQEEEQDMTIAMLPLNAKAQLMGSVTTEVGRHGTLH